jgi:electron transfer flavoprotein alpha subunit
MASADPVNLRSAQTIVAIGAGVTTGEAFTLVRQLAECLRASIAGTRPALDRGFITREQMIGATGATVRPDVYIAIGISGASQHLSGMDAAATIIAINRDPEAPIVRVADHAIIGNLSDIVPRLIDACRNGATIDAMVTQFSEKASDGQLLHRQR